MTPEPGLVNWGVDGTLPTPLHFLPWTLMLTQAPKVLVATHHAHCEYLQDVRSPTTPRKARFIKKMRRFHGTFQWWTGRKAEGKGRDTEMCRDAMRSKCPQTSGLPSPPPGYFRLRRREIEECGHDYSRVVFAVASCGRLLHSGVFKKKPGGQCGKEEGGIAQEFSLGGSQGHRLHVWPSRQLYSPLWRKTTGSHKSSMLTSVISMNHGMETHSFHQVPWHLLLGPRWRRTFTVALVLPWLEWCLSFANHILPTPAGCLQFSERPGSGELPETR